MLRTAANGTNGAIDKISSPEVWDAMGKVTAIRVAAVI